MFRKSTCPSFECASRVPMVGEILFLVNFVSSASTVSGQQKTAMSSFGSISSSKTSFQSPKCYLNQIYVLWNWLDWPIVIESWVRLIIVNTATHRSWVNLAHLNKLLWFPGPRRIGPRTPGVSETQYFLENGHHIHHFVVFELYRFHSKNHIQCFVLLLWIGLFVINKKICPINDVVYHLSLIFNDQSEEIIYFSFF